jgi:FtsP/CotA-like multicopper oxidase with cupredoxin domain
MVTRRELLVNTAAVAAVSQAAATIARAAPVSSKPAVSSPTSSPSSSARPSLGTGKTWTPNGVTLESRVSRGARVMHLVAEEVTHEFCEGLVCRCWGYNGRTIGPTIEVTEGERVRIYVTNRLPEPTSVHWHGLTLPNGMDGVAGLTQRPIQPGETFKYEFDCPTPGTYMYHPHYDEMTQMAMGMMGMFIVLPRREPRPVDLDVVMLLSEWSVPAGASRPNPLAMMDFNVLTINSRAFPGTAPVVVERGSKVRFRIGNLSAMDHHAMHLHAFPFTVVATDGGEVPPSARFPEVTTLVAVGSTKTLEFVASENGDWAFHCHMTHHGMNQMGHGIPSLIGAELAQVRARLAKHSPDVMLMGEAGMGGMADMFEMGMKYPVNSIPMKGGKGPFSMIEMGGMFTVVKVRPTGRLDDEWYKHPAGEVADVANAADLAADGVILPKP